VDDCGINEASKETTAVVLMEDYICMSSVAPILFPRFLYRYFFLFFLYNTTHINIPS